MYLRTDRIMEEQTWLLPSCAGEATQVLVQIREQLETATLTDLACREESLAPGFLAGLMGRRRDCVSVRHRFFREVVVLAGAYDHGQDLLVFWTAAATPSMFGRLSRLVRFGFRSDLRYEIGPELDAFQSWSLGAFLETTRNAVVGAIAGAVEERQIFRTKSGMWTWVS